MPSYSSRAPSALSSPCAPPNARGPYTYSTRGKGCVYCAVPVPVSARQRRSTPPREKDASYSTPYPVNATQRARRSGLGQDLGPGPGRVVLRACLYLSSVKGGAVVTMQPPKG